MIPMKMIQMIGMMMCIVTSQATFILSLGLRIRRPKFSEFVKMNIMIFLTRVVYFPENLSLIIRDLAFLVNLSQNKFALVKTFQ